MITFSDFKENNGASTDDLIDYESRHDYKEYWAEGQNEMELPSKDVLVCLVEEVVHDLLSISVLKFFILQELCFWHSAINTYTS